MIITVVMIKTKQTKFLYDSSTMVRNPPSPAPADPYDLFLSQYFQTDPLNRINIITCTCDIGGILFFLRMTTFQPS